jgi:RNA polymerase sigma-70 factor (ECF subfamily)
MRSRVFDPVTATARKPMTDNRSEPDDAELVARFLGGERAAFDALVVRYQRPIYWLAHRYVGNDADAKDVAQRALVQAFVKVRALREVASFRAWVYRVAANLALNVVRDRKPAALLDEELAAAPPPRERLIEDETQRRLRRAVAQLPPQQRLVVELRVFEELPFRAVGEIAECSEDSAKVSFHHALKKLRVLMNEENEP